MAYERPGVSMKSVWNFSRGVSHPRSGVVRTAADILKASLESAERLQNQNLVAIRTAIVEQSKSLSELGEAKTLDELMALQARIAGEQFQRTMGYWTNLCQTAGQNQLAVIGQMRLTEASPARRSSGASSS